MCRADGLNERRERISREAVGERGKARWEIGDGRGGGGARRHVQDGHIGWKACNQDRDRNRNHNRNRNRLFGIKK